MLTIPVKTSGLVPPARSTTLHRVVVNSRPTRGWDEPPLIGDEVYLHSPNHLEAADLPDMVVKGGDPLDIDAKPPHYDERCAHGVGPFQEQRRDAVLPPGRMRLARIAEGDPERRIEEGPAAVHQRCASSSANTHCPRFLTYFLGDQLR